MSAAALSRVSPTVQSTQSESRATVTHDDDEEEEDNATQSNTVAETLSNAARTKKDKAKMSSQSGTVRERAVKGIKEIKKELTRPHWYVVVYVLFLPVYILAGGALFQHTDGERDRQAAVEYSQRCMSQLAEAKANVSRILDAGGNKSGQDLEQLLATVDTCHREYKGQPVNAPFNRYGWAVVYAFSVITTIGWGQVIAVTPTGQIMTVFYALLGIPYYFAVLSDLTEWTLHLLHMLYKLVSGVCCPSLFATMKAAQRDNLRDARNYGITAASPGNACMTKGVFSGGRLRTTTTDGIRWGVEVRRLFLWSLTTVFVVAYCTLGGVYTQWAERSQEWSLSESIYSLFQSMATIGFGDYAPGHHGHADDGPEDIEYWATLSTSIVVMVVGQVFWSIWIFHVRNQIQFAGMAMRLWNQRKDKTESSKPTAPIELTPSLTSSLETGLPSTPGPSPPPPPQPHIVPRPLLSRSQSAEVLTSSISV